MPDETIAIAPVALARDLRRIMALPALLALLGASGLVAGTVLGGMTGLAIGAAGVVAVIVAAVLIVAPLTLRMEVEVGGLRLRWLGGSRRFHLVRGPVTRVGLAGPSAGLIRSRFPILGWSIGGAILRGEEPIVLVRLARTPTVIVVPTDVGRLAIGAASEPDLLEALGAAARVQQRLDEVGGRVLAAFPDGLAARRIREPPAPPPVEEPRAEVDTGRFLTGIERARLEARLAAAREATLLAAEAERLAAIEREQASAGALARGEPRPTTTYEEEGEPPVTAPSRVRQRVAAAWTRPPWATDARVRTLGTIAWALVPLVASVGAWGLATANPSRAAADGISARLIGLALTMGGPAAALGVIAARTWWPRLAGLVTVTAVAALVLTARAVMP